MYLLFSMYSSLGRSRIWGLLFQQYNQWNKPISYGCAQLRPFQGPTGSGHSPMGHCADQTPSLFPSLSHFQIAPKSTSNSSFHPEASSSSSDKSECTQLWQSCWSGRGSFHHPEIKYQNILLQVCFAGQNWLKKKNKKKYIYIHTYKQVGNFSSWAFVWVSSENKCSGDRVLKRILLTHLAWMLDTKPWQHFATKGEKMWKQWDKRVGWGTNCSKGRPG